MGSVYEAQHVTLQRRFAIKFMLPEYAANRATLRRFENEAKAAGGLEHPNIAAVTDLGQATDGSPYLVMEFLKGLDGSKLLASLGPLPVPRATNIVFQACLGLAVAHQVDIVHRDIKPENLLISDAGDGTDLVKILDFGIAKLRSPDASVATASGMLMGTYYYMSPEQIRDTANVDQRTDVWALGVVLYELLTGHRPFNGEQATEIMYKIVHESPKSLIEIRPELPSDLVKVINRALEKDADKRLASVAALASALAPFTGRPSVHPVQPNAAGDTATRQKSVAPTDAIHATTSHAAVSTTSKISGASSTRAPKRRRAILIAAIVLALVIGAAGLLATRTDGRVQSNATSSPGPAMPSGANAAAPGSLAQPPPATASVVPANTSGNVRTMSEVVQHDSDRTPSNAADKANSRLSVPQRPKKPENSRAASSLGTERAETQPVSPVSIDTSSPY
jgi:serine/threonine-protein kinase